MGKSSGAPSPNSANTSVTTSSPPSQFLNAYTGLVNQAQNQASQPLQQYSGPLVAGFTPQQQQGFQTVQNLQGAYAPYINAAAQEFGNASGTNFWNTLPQYNTSGLPTQGLQNFSGAANIGNTVGNTAYTNVSPGDIAAYENPFQSSVTNALTNLFNQQNAQQLSQVRGNAGAQNALGGDREAVAEALTAQQQQLAEAPTLANVGLQGWQSALGAAQQQKQSAQQQQQLNLAGGQLGLQAGAQQLGQFNTQQQQQLAAEQAQAWLESQAGFGLANLGSETQNLGLSGANANIQAGGAQQALAQQQLNIPYEQFIQAQAYPYQQLNWLSGIVEGAGGLAGGSSQTTAPGPNVLGQVAGLGLAGAGALGASGAFGSNGWLTGNGTGTDPFNAATFDAAQASGQATTADLSGLFSNRGGRIAHAHGGRIGLAGGGPPVPGGALPITSGVPDVSVSYIPAFSQGPGANSPIAQILKPQTQTVQQSSSGSSGGGGSILGDLSAGLGIGKLVAGFLARGGGVNPTITTPGLHAEMHSLMPHMMGSHATSGHGLGLPRLHLEEGGNASADNFARNQAYLLPGDKSYATTLPPDQEQSFRQWVQQNRVRFNPDATGPSDYDMRGFYKGLMSGDPNAQQGIDPNDKRMHYNDYWKTPYHPTFSAGSQWADPEKAPRWDSNNVNLALPDGTVIYTDSPQTKGQHGDLFPQAGSEEGRRFGGRIGLQGGGMATAPLDAATPLSGFSPNVQGEYQQFTQLPLEKLQELAARVPPTSYQGMLVQRALNAKRMNPGSGTAQPTAPAMSPLSLPFGSLMPGAQPGMQQQGMGISPNLGLSMPPQQQQQPLGTADGGTINTQSGESFGTQNPHQVPQTSMPLSQIQMPPGLGASGSNTALQNLPLAASGRGLADGGPAVDKALKMMMIPANDSGSWTLPYYAGPAIRESTPETTRNIIPIPANDRAWGGRIGLAAGGDPSMGIIPRSSMPPLPDPHNYSRYWGMSPTEPLGSPGAEQMLDEHGYEDFKSNYPYGWGVGEGEGDAGRRFEPRGVADLFDIEHNARGNAPGREDELFKQREEVRKLRSGDTEDYNTPRGAQLAIVGEAIRRGGRIGLAAGGLPVGISTYKAGNGVDIPQITDTATLFGGPGVGSNPAVGAGQGLAGWNAPLAQLPRPGGVTIPTMAAPAVPAAPAAPVAQPMPNVPPSLAGLTPGQIASIQGTIPSGDSSGSGGSWRGGRMGLAAGGDPDDDGGDKVSPYGLNGLITGKTRERVHPDPSDATTGATIYADPVTGAVATLPPRETRANLPSQTDEGFSRAHSPPINYDSSASAALPPPTTNQGASAALPPPSARATLPPPRIGMGTSPYVGVIEDQARSVGTQLPPRGLGAQPPAVTRAASRQQAAGLAGPQAGAMTPPAGQPTSLLPPSQGGEGFSPAGLQANRGFESAGDPAATNPRSSAAGADQFLKNTWLGLIKSAHPDIAAGKTDAQLLAMRGNEKLSAQITQDYAKVNAGILQQHGFPVNDTTLSLAHNFGGAGASKILGADPKTPMAQLVSAQALAANPWLKGKTAGDVIASRGAMMSGAARAGRPGGGLQDEPPVGSGPTVEAGLGNTNYLGNITGDDRDTQQRIGDRSGHKDFLSSPWMIPLAVGAGMLASRSPYAGVQLGEGLETGIKVAGQENERETRAEVAEARARAAGDVVDVRRQSVEQQGQHFADQAKAASDKLAMQQQLGGESLTIKQQLADAATQRAQTAEANAASMDERRKAETRLQEQLNSIRNGQLEFGHQDPNDPNSPSGYYLLPKNPDPNNPNQGKTFFPTGAPKPGGAGNQTQNKIDALTALFGKDEAGQAKVRAVIAGERPLTSSEWGNLVLREKSQDPTLTDAQAQQKVTEILGKRPGAPGAAQPAAPASGSDLSQYEGQKIVQGGVRYRVTNGVAVPIGP